jgi:hypothetical protein
MPTTPTPAPRKTLSTEQQCDALIKLLGGIVVQMGQKGKRTRNTKGIPDRLYFVQTRMVFFEVKSANDYLSPEQFNFLTSVLAYNGVAGCGNRDDLCELLNAPNARKVSLLQIDRYSNRKGRGA